MDCCIICHETINQFDTLTTTCNHTFHASCIDRWARTGGNFVGTCPICRNDISMFGVVFENSDDFYLPFNAS